MTGFVSLYAAPGTAGIEHAELLLDSRRITSVQASPPAPVVVLQLPEQPIGSGQRVLTLRLVRGARPGEQYFAGGGVAVVNGRTLEALDFRLPPDFRVMSSGDEIRLQFVVP